MSRTKGKFIESHKESWTTLTTRTFTHNLGSTDLIVSMWDLTTGERVFEDSMTIVDSDNLEVVVNALPASGIRVVILGL